MTSSRLSDLTILDNIRIAAHCPADWNKMSGDDRSRFCGECQKHVYNLSAMSAEAAVALIHEKEGNLCGRLYRRADGTVLTADCPVGVRAVVWRTRRLVAACVSAAAVGLMLVVLPNPNARGNNGNQSGPRSRVVTRAMELVDETLIWLGLRNPAPAVMGVIACPLPPPIVETTEPIFPDPVPGIDDVKAEE
jgi:hypothetical protein